jgi:Helix-turn-helix domain
MEVTTSEAVRQFQMHPATVLRLILTRRVEARKDADGKWLIRLSDLERWNRQRRISKHEQISVASTEAAT